MGARGVAVMAREYDPKKILRRTEELAQEAKGLRETAIAIRKETAKLWAEAKKLRTGGKLKAKK